MEIVESLQKLWGTTGLANFVLPADPTITDTAQQSLHQYGSPIMLVVCLFLLWLGVKKQFEPLLLVPIAFGGFLANIPLAGIAGEAGMLGIIYNVEGVDPEDIAEESWALLWNEKYIFTVKHLLYCIC